MAEPTKSNTICWVEIPVTDMDRAAAFYTEVFGWKVQPMGEMNYAMFVTEGGVGGGLDPSREPCRKQGVVNYICVPDIEAALKSVEAGGGATEHPKTTVGEYGWMALFRDTEGNILGLWTGAGGGS